MIQEQMSEKRLSICSTLAKVPVWFLGDHCHWPVTVTVMQHNASHENKWPDLTCLSGRWPSIVLVFSWGEGWICFFCWHWRSGHGGGARAQFHGLFVQCGFGSALLIFSVLTIVCWRPQSGSSGGCHSGTKCLSSHRPSDVHHIMLRIKALVF